MFEVQVNSKSDIVEAVTIFESVHLKAAQAFYHDSRRDYPNVNIRLIEVLRHS